MTTDTCHEYASSPEYAPRPGEFARENRKSNRDYNHGRPGQHDHDSAEKKHGKANYGYDHFAHNGCAIETKATG